MKQHSFYGEAEAKWYHAFCCGSSIRIQHSLGSALGEAAATAVEVGTGLDTTAAAPQINFLKTPREGE